MTKKKTFTAFYTIKVLIYPENMLNPVHISGAFHCTAGIGCTEFFIRLTYRQLQVNT